MNNVKIFHHRFTGEIPIIFIDSEQEIAKIFKSQDVGTTSPSASSRYANVIYSLKMEASKMEFIVINKGLMMSLFGSTKQSIIDSILALHVGYVKNPKKDKAAYDHAIMLLSNAECEEALFSVIQHYRLTFGTEPEYISTFVELDDEENIDEVLFEGKVSSSLNAEGKKFADAIERATLEYLANEFTTAEASGEKMFINNPEAFSRWQPTFKLTRDAVEDIISGNINAYNIVHDGSRNNFSTAIANTCKAGGKSKDAWNPADVWLVKRSQESAIISELDTIKSTDVDKTVKLAMLNALIYKCYEDKTLYPISLKRVTTKKARVEYSNTPGSTVEPIVVKSVSFSQCNMLLDTMEIGGFSIETENGNNIVFQNKGYPTASDSTQVEITSTGEKSGGRTGKVPKKIIEDIYSTHDMEKIKPSSEFGKGRSFDKFLVDKSKAKKYYEWFEIAKKKTSSTPKTFKSADELYEYISEIVHSDVDVRQIKVLKHKIQGLQMQYLLSKSTNSELSNIMTKMVYGAKKISPDSGFFIKIY